MTSSATNPQTSATSTGGESIPSDVTVAYRLDPAGPALSYTCSFGVAVGIVSRPASGVAAMRIKGALEQHPAIISAMANRAELRDNLRNLLDRLEALLPYSLPKQDGGWVKSGSDLAARLNAALVVQNPNPAELAQGIADCEGMIARSGASLAKKAYYLAKVTPAKDLAREYILARRPELEATAHELKLAALVAKAAALDPALLAPAVLELRLKRLDRPAWHPVDSTTDYDSDEVGYVPTGQYPASYQNRDRLAPPPSPTWPAVQGFYPHPATPEDRIKATRMARKAAARQIGIARLRDAILSAANPPPRTTPYQHQAPRTLQPSTSATDHSAHVEAYHQHRMRLAAWQSWTAHWVTDND